MNVRTARQRFPLLDNATATVEFDREAQDALDLIDELSAEVVALRSQAETFGATVNRQDGTIAALREQVEQVRGRAVHAEAELAALRELQRRLATAAHENGMFVSKLLDRVEQTDWLELAALRERCRQAEEDADRLAKWFQWAKPAGTYTEGSTVAEVFAMHEAAVAGR